MHHDGPNYLLVHAPSYFTTIHTFVTFKAIFHFFLSISATKYLSHNSFLIGVQIVAFFICPIATMNAGVTTFASAANTASGSCNSFALSFQPDPTKRKMVSSSLKKTTPPDIARTILADPGTAFQYLCVINSQTTVLSRPFPASDNVYNVSVLLANRGDTMDLFFPMSLPTKYHHGHHISLVPSHVVHDLEWNTSHVDPAQLEPPGAVDLLEPAIETKAVDDPPIKWLCMPPFTLLRVTLLPTSKSRPARSTTICLR
jgi:hypothetical protein